MVVDLVTRTVDADGLGRVTLRYPSGDGFTPAMGRAMRDALASVTADQDCRAIVLTAEGADFCPGGGCATGDAGAAGSVIAARADGLLATEVFRLLARSPRPLVAAVAGRAEGIGVALAAACDHVVAAEDAVFRCDAVGDGRLPEGGALWSLPQRLGAARAARFLLLGESLDAAQAVATGLADSFAGRGEAVAVAEREARRYLALPPVAEALTRMALYNSTRSITEALRIEANVAPFARQSPDHMEAVKAFLEKRAPRFTGH
jgi:enoyl-CoA hydratase/carnithine racemase